ncbi:MAG: hydrolase [Deltaproteobacteria bacterium]|nr:hydrolase [Deltaproteobacteria bacterium]
MLTVENTMLIVIDIQGNLYESMHEKEFLFNNLAMIVKGAQVMEIPILVTEQIPEKLGPTIPQLTELLTGIQPVPKASFSCCSDDGFMKELKAINRGQILMTGIESHVCVYQTTMDLIDAGYEVNLLADGVSSRTSMNRAIGIERMVNGGAKLSSTEMALFELVKTAEGDKFRQMIRIVK